MYVHAYFHLLHSVLVNSFCGYPSLKPPLLVWPTVLPETQPCLFHSHPQTLGNTTNPGLLLLLIHFSEPFQAFSQGKSKQWREIVNKWRYPVVYSSVLTNNLAAERRIMFSVQENSWRMRNLTYFQAVWKSSFSPLGKNI